MTTALEIKNMSFKYDTSYIFDKFNLKVKKNDFLYLIGLNNSGKTTLINIINGYPCDGDVYINGLELNNKNKDKIFGFTNIIDKDKVNKCKLTNIIDKIKELSGDKYDNYLKDYKLLEVCNNNYNQLHLLDKIKVFLFISLLENYQFLIIDEIIDMLDSSDKYIIYKLIKKYQRVFKKTILIISKNADGIIYAKRILILSQGRICFDGSINDVDKNDNLFNDLSIRLPFIVDLSIKLKLYDLIKEIYVDEKRMIKDIWKK